MNRLPLATAALSALAAITLWLVATWLERGSISPAPDISGAAQSTVRSDTPLSTDSAAGLTCPEAEQQMRDRVQDSRGCSVDAECAIFDYGYPIECMTSVARDQISALRTHFRSYHESCEYRVYYDCPTGDMQRRPVCKNNQCNVELVNFDSLKDETLDHLGLD